MSLLSLIPCAKRSSQGITRSAHLSCETGTGNVYQIDAVIYHADDRPIVIIDPKYIRYTKHNRDKGSWLCVAHYNLRKTHHSIRKSLAVLAGRWPEPSIGADTELRDRDSRSPFRSHGGRAGRVPESNSAGPNPAARPSPENHSATSRDSVKEIDPKSAKR